jgi:hypothetical protein
VVRGLVAPVEGRAAPVGEGGPVVVGLRPWLLGGGNGYMPRGIPGDELAGVEVGPGPGPGPSPGPGRQQEKRRLAAGHPAPSSLLRQATRTGKGPKGALSGACREPGAGVTAAGSSRDWLRLSVISPSHSLHCTALHCTLMQRFYSVYTPQESRRSGARGQGQTTRADLVYQIVILD